MILCVGEILADMIGTVKDGSLCYERKAGGAPFNVACAAKKFGADVKFVGSVGNDLIGDFLIKFADGRKLDGITINRDAKRNTTLAFVELDEKGERSFCFYRKNTADYNLPYISQSEFEDADIVHVGSLMLSEKAGFEYAESIAKRTRAEGKLLSFDINYRTDIFKDRESAVNIYKKII
ncbi:MAG: carbohydrate kinase, partial [Clostridia bacterium]|nr:carbohydrate kinase [Clostridia bacterium]